MKVVNHLRHSLSYHRQNKTISIHKSDTHDRHTIIFYFGIVIDWILTAPFSASAYSKFLTRVVIIFQCYYKIKLSRDNQQDETF
jgi:hypothetical protein